MKKHRCSGPNTSRTLGGSKYAWSGWYSKNFAIASPLPCSIRDASNRVLTQTLQPGIPSEINDTRLDAPDGILAAKPVLRTLPILDGVVVAVGMKIQFQC